MPRRVTEVSNMEIDEISLVDRPANQHAHVVLSKRASEEDTVPNPKIFDATGQELDVDTVKVGDTVYDEDGDPWEIVDAAEDAPDEGADVSKAFTPEDIRDELSKAFTEVERDEVIAKAFGKVAELQSELSKAQATIAETQKIAKAEQDKRLMVEYIEVAKSYNIPGDPVKLAPVLKRMSETMSYEDCEVIHKALQGAGQTIFDEIGNIGGGDNADVMSQVSAFLASEDVSKAAAEASISKAQQVDDYFSTHPDAYDTYRAEMARF